MPFTISHVAAVVPLRNSKLSYSAMAIGSMSPDFSYILSLFGPHFEGHTLIGALTFSLPAALLVWSIYEHFLAKAWSVVFPWIKTGPPGTTRTLVFVSALFGVLTHVFWDGLTHQHGWAVQHLAVLRLSADFGVIASKPVFKYLQHLSSLIGLAVVVIAVRDRMHATGNHFIGSFSRLRQACACFGIFAAIMCAPMFFSWQNLIGTERLENVLFQLAIEVLAATGVTLIAFPVLRGAIERFFPSEN
jgi:hypothetical protein